MRKLVIAVATLVVLAAAGGWIATRVRGRQVPRFSDPDPVAPSGVFHVHSDMSRDCKRSVPEIVAAAHADGLSFVVLDDHNDQYAGPFTREGVTILSYAELSTGFGHVVQLGAREVLGKAHRDDSTLHAAIRGIEGYPVITHPFDPKRPWTGAFAGAAGLEIVNLASSSRRAGGAAFVGLVPTLAGALFNPDLALAQLYDRDTQALAVWDRNDDPRFVGLCGVDSHDWISAAPNLRAWNVVLEQPLPEPEGARAAFILEQLLSGRFFCSAGLLGKSGRLRFGVQDAGRWIAGPGDTTARAGTEALVASYSPVGGTAASLVLFRNGQAIKRGQGELRLEAPDPGTYRVEVWVDLPNLLFGEHTVPVLYSQRLRVVEPPTGTTSTGAQP